MSALALKGNSFYRKMIEDLGLMPSNVPEWIKEVPEHVRGRKCATRQCATTQQYFFFFFVPDCLKTQEMCIKALELYLWSLEYVLDKLKVQKMCDDAVWDDAFSLVCVPSWFVTQQQLKI